MLQNRHDTPWCASPSPGKPLKPLAPRPLQDLSSDDPCEDAQLPRAIEYRRISAQIPRFGGDKNSKNAPSGATNGKISARNAPSQGFLRLTPRRMAHTTAPARRSLWHDHSSSHRRRKAHGPLTRTPFQVPMRPRQPTGGFFMPAARAARCNTEPGQSRPSVKIGDSYDTSDDRSENGGPGPQGSGRGSRIRLPGRRGSTDL